MNTITGDLIEFAENGQFEVIIHGCNCFCQMGAGIAKQIKSEYPEAYQEDCKTKKGDKSKLGNYSWKLVTGKYEWKFIIINAYTQYHYGRGINADYNAIRSVFKSIKQNFNTCKIAYPKIGAGMAGGDWNVIKSIIEEELSGCDHTLVVLPNK